MIKSDTVYYVNCDKCDTHLTHVFDKFTFEEEYQFDSIEECHYAMKRHGWLLTESGNCYCPKCGKEMSKELSGKSEKYVKLSDILKLVEESICDLESNYDKDMFIEDINKLETKEIRIREK